jgi:hypothetical protein
MLDQYTRNLFAGIVIGNSPVDYELIVEKHSCDLDAFSPVIPLRFGLLAQVSAKKIEQPFRFNRAGHPYDRACLSARCRTAANISINGNHEFRLPDDACPRKQRRAPTR